MTPNHNPNYTLVIPALHSIPKAQHAMHREPATMRKAKRLSVKSFADAMKQLRAANAKLVELEHGKQAAIGNSEAARMQARDAMADAKAARAEHDDLKKRLLDAEVECARLRGYMERVREDDAVADPLVEIEDHSGKRMVSKRHPTPQFANMLGSGTEYASYDQYGRQKEKPKHWVTY